MNEGKAVKVVVVVVTTVVFVVGAKVVVPIVFLAEERPLFSRRGRCNVFFSFGFDLEVELLCWWACMGSTIGRCGLECS